MAENLGFGVSVVPDATATFDRTALAGLAGEFAAVRSTDSLLDAVGAER